MHVFACTDAVLIPVVIAVGVGVGVGVAVALLCPSSLFCVETHHRYRQAQELSGSSGAISRDEFIRLCGRYGFIAFIDLADDSDGDGDEDAQAGTGAGDGHGADVP